MMVKRALSESACPPHILDELMENCHERRWPRGLSSLETRQNNRRIYDNYVCRRVPNKQAVLVLPCDNSHMSDDVMTEPGLVCSQLHFNKVFHLTFRFFHLLIGHDFCTWHRIKYNLSVAKWNFSESLRAL